MSNGVSLCMRPLFRRSRPGVFAARRCKARRRKGVDGAPIVPREILRATERFTEEVAVVGIRPGVASVLVAETGC